VERTWSPAVDVVEDAKAFRLAFEIPGVNAEDVKIHLDHQQLTVSGEKKQEIEDNNDRFYRFERRFGSFTRTFTLPDTVNPDAIEARVQNGVLSLTLPKVEKAQPRAIPVKSA
jgi:HSP20 family protein